MMALGFLTGLGWLVMNTPDMSVFIGSGFDIERPNSLGQILTIQLDANDELFGAEIPRLKKPQVLADYSFLESLEGFEFEAYWYHKENKELTYGRGPLTGIRKSFALGWQIIWVSFVGVQKGSIYEAWARQNEIPVINDDGEVVA